MDIMLQRGPNNYLIPADQESLAAVQKWPVGQGVMATVKRVRNIKLHRKFFGLLSVIASYSDVYDNTDKALVAVKLAAGHVDWIAHPDGKALVPVPKSISFASLDEDSFSKFYSNAIDAVLKHILPQMDEQSLNAAVNDVLSFT